MPRRLYLIRHGETEANRLKIIQGQNKKQVLNHSAYGDPLNCNGVKQAALLGKILAGVSFQFAYSSPAIRALDTANIVMFYNKKAWGKIFAKKEFIKIENGLLEIDQGAFEGMTADEIAAKCPALYNLYYMKPSQFSFPDGESLIEAKVRVGTAIDKILYDRPFEENILAVSHGGAISLAFIHIFGLDLDRMFHAIRHHNCAFSVIEWPSPFAAPRIECLNSASHLK